MANERKTPSGLDVQPVYRADGQTAHPVRDIGELGQYPYTRGIHPGMYRRRLWTMRQVAGPWRRTNASTIICSDGVGPVDPPRLTCLG